MAAKELLHIEFANSKETIALVITILPEAVNVCANDWNCCCVIESIRLVVFRMMEDSQNYFSASIFSFNLSMNA
jgi:hypothetical protein